MQSKSTFLEFLDVYSSLQIWPPRKIIQGLWPRFNAYIHVESPGNKKLFHRADWEKSDPYAKF